MIGVVHRAAGAWRRHAAVWVNVSAGGADHGDRGGAAGVAAAGRAVAAGRGRGHGVGQGPVAGIGVVHGDGVGDGHDRAHRQVPGPGQRRAGVRPRVRGRSRPRPRYRRHRPAPRPAESVTARPGIGGLPGVGHGDRVGHHPARGGHRVAAAGRGRGLDDGQRRVSTGTSAGAAAGCGRAAADPTAAEATVVMTSLPPVSGLFTVTGVPDHRRRAGRQVPRPGQHRGRVGYRAGGGGGVAVVGGVVQHLWRTNR